MIAKNLSVIAAATFDQLARLRSVAVPRRKLARLQKLRVAQILGPLGELESAGLVCLWAECKVTLSPYAAATIGLKLNSRSSAWMPAKGWREPSARLLPRTVEGVHGWAIVVNESETDVDPPGILSRVVDHRSTEPIEKIMAAEKREGLPKPNYLVGMELPWPRRGQDRGPHAPTVDPEVGRWACFSCGGAPLRNDDHIKAYCPVCDNYCAETRFSVVRRIESGKARDAAERKQAKATRKQKMEMA